MGHCGQEQLRTAMLNGQPSLVIIDVEGAEGHLLDPGNIPGLANAHVIVEIHDFVDDQVGETVVVTAEIKPCHRRSADARANVLGFS